jgi:hypothetical protein
MYTPGPVYVHKPAEIQETQPYKSYEVKKTKTEIRRSGYLASRRRSLSSATSQLLQRIQQGPAQCALTTSAGSSARTRTRTRTCFSLACASTSPSLCFTRSSASASTLTGTTTASSSSIWHEDSPLANHVADSQRQLILLNLELELALAKNESVGLSAEAGDLALGDVDCV